MYSHYQFSVIYTAKIARHARGCGRNWWLSRTENDTASMIFDEKEGFGEILPVQTLLRIEDCFRVDIENKQTSSERPQNEE